MRVRTRLKRNWPVESIDVSTGPRTLRFACAFRCDDEVATSATSAARTAPARRTCFFAEAERPRFETADESVNAVLLRTLRALLSTIRQVHQHLSGADRGARRPAVISAPADCCVEA